MGLDPLTSSPLLKSSTATLVTVCTALGFFLGLMGLGGEGALLGGLGGAVFGFALDLFVSSRRARRDREQGVLDRWAAKRGLLYNASSPVFRDTPLLYAGDEQEGRYGFTGEIFGLRGTVYEHITRYKEEGSNGPGGSHCYLVLHLVFELPRIGFLHIHPRLAIVPGELEALANRVTGSREVNLESAGLSERCRIEVNESCDEFRARRLLTPRATAILLDLCESEVFARGLHIEAEVGKLVFATPGRIDSEHMERVDDFLAAVQPFVVWLEDFAARSTSKPEVRNGRRS